MAKLKRVVRKPREKSNSSAIYIAGFTALISALVSLVVGLVSLNKRNRASSQLAVSGEIPADDYMLTAQEEGRPQTVAGSPSQPPASSVEGEIPVNEAGAQPVKTASKNSWSQTTKYIVGVGMFLFLLYVVYISRTSMGTIIFAALLAFVVRPMVRTFQSRLKMKQGSSIVLAYLIVVVVMIVIALFIIPAIAKSLDELLSVDWQKIAQNLIASLQVAAQNVSANPVIGPALASALDSLAQMLTDLTATGSNASIVINASTVNMRDQLASMIGELASMLGPLISAIASLIFMLLISLRMSFSVNDMKESYPKVVPEAYREEVTGLVERLIKIWSSFLSGQLSLMVVMGFLTYLLNVILGTPYAAFLGLLAGILEIIPNLGPILATIPAVIFALVFGSSHLDVSNVVFALIVILGYVLLSGLENQVIVPKILGDAVNLHPLVVLIGCLVGGAAFGLLGIFLATPVISTGRLIFSYLYNKIMEAPPTPEPPEEKPSIMQMVRGYTRRIRLPSFNRKQKSGSEQ
jgi:predicted PurR-regulated permease PerM